MISYTQPQTDDLDQIIELLSENILPTIDVHQHLENFIVAKKEGKVVGSIGLEKYGTDALLRSLAVSKTERGNGVAKELYNALAGYSKERGITTLHLLTTTADQYFTRLDFALSDREIAPNVIKSTLEFSQLCPSSSVYMKKNI